MEAPPAVGRTKSHSAQTRYKGEEGGRSAFYHIRALLAGMGGGVRSLWEGMNEKNAQRQREVGVQREGMNRENGLRALFCLLRLRSALGLLPLPSLRGPDGFRVWRLGQ
jgi:hypothetical protein